jgi:hypothetical protein
MSIWVFPADEYARCLFNKGLLLFNFNDKSMINKLDIMLTAIYKNKIHFFSLQQKKVPDAKANY